MRNKKFERIINTLEMDFLRYPETVALRKRVVTQCKTPKNAKLLLLELEWDDNYFGHSPEFHALSAFCKACAYYETGKANFQNLLMGEASTALELFRSAGNGFNEGLAHWFLGLVYQNQGERSLSLQEFSDAIKKLGAYAELSEAKSNYKKKDECRELIESIESSKKKIPPLPTIRPTSPAPVFPVVVTPPSAPPAPTPPPISTTILIDLPVNINTINQNRPVIDLQATSQSQPVIDLQATSQSQPKINLANENRPTFNPQISVPVETHSWSRIQQSLGPISIPAETLGFKPEMNSAEEIADAEEYITLPWLPIYQQHVKATRDGHLEFRPGVKNARTQVHQVLLNRELYTVYVVKKTATIDHIVSLTTNQNGYGWAKVVGKSMNNSKPPIDENDYVLFYKADDAQNNDVVIACRPKTDAEEIPYIVKRLRIKSKEKVLISETTEDGNEYKALHRADGFQILGVVVAVAKPDKARK